MAIKWNKEEVLKRFQEALQPVEEKIPEALPVDRKGVLQKLITRLKPESMKNA